MKPRVVPLGHCYDWAYRQTIGDTPGHTTLVHGPVTAPLSRPAHTYQHAWVERDGVVQDWQCMEAHCGGNWMGRGYPIAVFEELFCPTSVHRYTADEARVLAARSGHYGPWSRKGTRGTVGRMKKAAKKAAKKNPGKYYVLVYTATGKHIETFGPYKLASAKSFARIGSQTGGPRQIRRGKTGRVVREYQGGERTYPKNAAQERGLTKAEKPKAKARPTPRSRSMKKAKLPRRRRNAGGAAVPGHMWVISKQGKTYLVTIGSPTLPGSTLKRRFQSLDALKDWIKYDMPGTVSPTHVLDMTGLGLLKKANAGKLSGRKRNAETASQVVSALAGGWRRRKINVSTEAGPKEVNAEVMGVWAVHPRISYHVRRHGKAPDYVITHVPTGLAAAFIEPRHDRTAKPKAKLFVETLVAKHPELLNETRKDEIEKHGGHIKTLRYLMRMNPGKAEKGRGAQKLLSLAGPQRRNAGRLSGRKRNASASQVMGALSGKAPKKVDPKRVTRAERTKVNGLLHAAGQKYYPTQGELISAVDRALAAAGLLVQRRLESQLQRLYADSGKSYNLSVAREWHGEVSNSSLVMNVYRMQSGKYELTAYLS
jgi:hypothetical protein